ncbi:MAG TPA: tripartite tricarboxylate transporter substrate binding protein, partial [Gammaproteobacteria bacterium]|nr:tripartite tricarboxylate transporter substrate binding protein [Gammaproteobacteria bacterium]
MEKSIFLKAAAIAVAVAAAPFSAFAADIPCSTAKLIVPWNAGGDTDIVFRLVTNSMNSSGFKPQLQVVNIGGQSGNKGAKEAKESKPDGC